MTTIPIANSDEHFTCELKQGYRRKVALMVVAKMRLRGATDPRLGAYKCPYCHRWHVGRDRKGTR